MWHSSFRSSCLWLKLKAGWLVAMVKSSRNSSPVRPSLSCRPELLMMESLWVRVRHSTPAASRLSQPSSARHTSSLLRTTSSVRDQQKFLSPAVNADSEEHDAECAVCWRILVRVNLITDPLLLGMEKKKRHLSRTSINSLRSEHTNGTALHHDASCATAGSPAVSRGGFVLMAHSDAEILKNKKKGIFRRSILSGLKLRKSESKSSLASQRSKQSSFRSEAGMSTVSSTASDINSTISLGEGETELSVIEDDIDGTTTEVYMGEWKHDKRSGFGVSQRSDGLKYEGEWANNKRHGYGCMTFPDGTKEEGKYKQNVLVSGKRKNLIPLRASKIREKVDRAVEAAERAGNIAKQKAEIAASRTSHSRAKAEAATAAAVKAQEEAQIARIAAKEFSPSFQHRENGLKCQRPKHQNSSDDIEVISTETPPQQDSPELYRKGTTPSDVTPDDSPMRSPLCSPPSTPPPPPPVQKSRNKSAHFSRQLSVDEDRGGDIQMLLEGRGGEYVGPNSWSEIGGGRGEAEQLRNGDETPEEDGVLYARNSHPKKTLQQGRTSQPKRGPPSRGAHVRSSETQIETSEQRELQADGFCRAHRAETGYLTVWGERGISAPEARPHALPTAEIFTCCTRNGGREYSGAQTYGLGPHPGNHGDFAKHWSRHFVYPLFHLMEHLYSLQKKLKKKTKRKKNC
uniref:Junctophilin 3 n=1 Tax=Leptobrachium leishanense TaxID=445787 RepID=A0A8C5PXM8_9ANUR